MQLPGHQFGYGMHSSVWHVTGHSLSPFCAYELSCTKSGSVQGVMMLPASSLPAQGADTVYKRLWVHEVFRVFYDRLVDDSDRVWLLQQVHFTQPGTSLLAKSLFALESAAALHHKWKV